METKQSMIPELQQHTKLINLGTVMYLAKWRGCRIVITEQETETDEPVVLFDDMLYENDPNVTEIVDVDIDEIEGDVTFVVRKEITTQVNSSTIYPKYITTTLYEIEVEDNLLAGDSTSGSL